MFVCFHAGGLRSHVYLTGVPLSAGSPPPLLLLLCYLCRSPPARLLPPASPCSSLLGQLPSERFPPLPSEPGCSLGVLPGDCRSCAAQGAPFPASARQVGFQAGSRQRERAAFLEASHPAHDSSGFRGAVFGDRAPRRKQCPGPALQSGVVGTEVDASRRRRRALP